MILRRGIARVSDLRQALDQEGIEEGDEFRVVRASSDTPTAGGNGDRLGSRGGSTTSLSQAQTLFGDHRKDDVERVRVWILLTAHMRGEFHADDAANWKLTEPNVIGSTVNAMARQRELEKLNFYGQEEHRPGKAPAAHGRKSYVWRPTERGHMIAEQLLKHWSERVEEDGSVTWVANYRSEP